MNSEEILQALQRGKISREDAKKALTIIASSRVANTGNGQTLVFDTLGTSVQQSSLTQSPDQPPDGACWPRRSSDWSDDTRSPSAPLERRENIAIIGMSGKYPKAKNLTEYWDNLLAGKNAIREIPLSRFNVSDYYDPDPAQKGKMYCKWLGGLDEIEYFDPLFFHLSPAEAEETDPQQRLFLEEGYKAFEDAGYSPGLLSNRKCGVYLGIMGYEYALLLTQQKALEANILGNSAAIAAARIAYLLNLKGPAIAIDTACSSSLVATHLACQALRNQEIDMALVGGVTLYLTPDSYVGMCSVGMLSPDGQCKTFDESANGFVPGEGVGALVLKRLADAEADHDQIYGVIIGSGVNQDGATNGIMAPSVKSQIELEREIYENYQIDPESISYVEMHGTGTKLGDPIELEALATVFQEKTQRKQYCAVGSVKSNIGHTSAAAGVASLHKVLLAMKQKKLVPTLHFERPNPHFDFAASPFYVNTEVRDWHTATPGDPLRAAVSSFGFSGTNAHMVIEEYIPKREANRDYSDGDSPYGPCPRGAETACLFVLSAESEQQLKIYAQAMKRWIQAHEELALSDIAFTLQVGRSAMDYRVAIVADSREVLLQRLDRFVDKQASTGLCIAQVKSSLGACPPSDATLFEADGDGQSLLHIWCQRKNLEKIAQVWVRGVNIDWKHLYTVGARTGASPVPTAPTLPYRVSLPTYPFARERYWIHTTTVGTEPGSRPLPTESLTAATVVSLAALHPLVQHNISDFFTQRFSSTFYGDEFFLVDHVINGQRIMPGVAYLEMICAAVAQAMRITVQKEEPFWHLSHVVWVRPLVVSSSSVTVQITLSPQGSETIAFAISREAEHSSFSTEGETVTQIYCQGQAILHAKSTVQSLDLAAIQTRCQHQISATRCYERYREFGIIYGPTMQGIERLSVGEGEVLARLRLPAAPGQGQAPTLQAPEVTQTYAEGASKRPHPYVLHPSMLDAALQACIGLHIEQNAYQWPQVPFALEELSLLGEIPVEGWAWVRQRPGSGTGAGSVCDIEVCDDEGRVAVRLYGLSTRPLPTHSEGTSTILLMPSWKEEPDRDRPHSYDPPEKTLLPTQQLTPETSNLLVLLCDLPYIQASRLQAQMAPGGRCRNLPISQPRRELGFQDAVGQLIEELQYLLRTRSAGAVLVQVVVAQREEPSLLEALTGVLKTAQQEYPQLNGQLIEVEGEPEEGQLLTWLGENQLRISQDTHIRYRDGKRWVRKWQEYRDVTPSVEIPWKEGGCYLISGGAGGLARLLVQEIARQIEEATVILVGRSALSVEQRVQLESVARESCATGTRSSSGGLHIDYQQVDVSDGPSVHALIRRILQESGHLNGIIHAAGVLRDSLLINKTQEEVRAVLTPKVVGVERLDEASAEIPLDFFVMCSSLAAVVGNMGQADYAAANAYLDAFAHARHALVAVGKRQGTTISINWPLWEEAGMQAEEGTTQIIRERLGVETMGTETGMKILYQALVCGQAQMVVVHGQVERIKQRLLQGPGFAVETAAKLDLMPSWTPETGEQAVIPMREVGGALQERADAYLKKQLAALIKAPVARIDALAPLEDYGFDSVMVMRFTNILERSFGPLPKTLLFQYSTLHSITEYFLHSYPEQFRRALRIEEAGGTSLTAMAIPQVPQRQIGAWPDPYQTVSLQFHDHPHDRLALLRKGGLDREQANHRIPTQTSDIAIIGVAGRYPQARDLRTFWENLCQGRDCITEIPRERWDYRPYFEANKNKPGTTCSKWGGFLEGVDEFDPLFFNISPQEAERMDPQERLFLECAIATLEDAGYTPWGKPRSYGEPRSYGKPGSHDMSQGSGLGGNVGVFVGVMYEEYQLFGVERQIQGQPVALGGSPSSIANRVSYFCNFHGPSMAVDTMCSSSLTALHLACQSIKCGNCEAALAGGVNVSIHPNKYLALGQGQFVSSQGHCESFGQGADGYVPSEGVGAVLLKPLAQAEKDGDHIYGVIKATAINHGGKTNGYTVPNPQAQAEVIGQALKEAGMDPRTISYIEAHGTGTKLGDPIEIAGLTRAFVDPELALGGTQDHVASVRTSEGPWCAIGSVKSNIGHAESAAGIAGVTKVLLQMRYGQLVPSLHAEVLNPHIDFSATPFVVQQELSEWKRPQIPGMGEVPRRAGISSFGAGGSNAHVILEEYVARQETDDGKKARPAGPAFIVLSARSPEQLNEQVQQLLSWMREEISGRLVEQGTQATHPPQIADLAYTLQVGRKAMEERLALQVSSFTELEEKLCRYLQEPQGAGDWYRGQVIRNDAISIFTEDEDGQKAIAAWMSKGKYEKLLEFWVKGGTVSWKLLYTAGVGQAQGTVSTPPRRISLPTYPFARERYWIPTCLPDSESGTISAIPAIRQSSMPANFSSLFGQRSRSDIATSDEILAFMISYLVDILSTVLKISPEKLDPQVEFDEYGLDSVLITRLHQMSEEVFGTIPTTIFFQYKCISDLAHYFLKEHAETLNVLFLQRGNNQSLQREEKSLGQPQKASSSSTEYQEPIAVEASSVSTVERDIAIIGISGHYPQAESLDQFWSNLASGRDCIVEIPQERWDYRKYYQPKNGTGGKTGGMYCRWGSFLPDVDTFDPSFFNISPLEARFMDPQERHFLQIVCACFEDAGYSKHLLRDESAGDGRANVGVFAGVTYNNYQLHLIKEYEQGNVVPVNTQTYSIANRVSYIYNLSGPSMSVDTACSSSLVAIHLACESIKRGECAMAIAGGVNLSLHPSKYITLCTTQFASSDGRCRSFGEDGDGYVPGEGVGAVLLKPLSNALADGDHIYALIKGTAVNNDGKTFGYSVPNPVAQTEVIRKALETAHVHPRSISYVEAHGTGTKLGDPIEITGLSNAFKKDTTDKQYCAIGSVKSNIGHLEAAAGISQVTKVVLQMKHKRLAPSLLHTSKLNPHIDFENTPFFVQQTLGEWKQPILQINGEEVIYPRRAGISSFGAGGVNIHIILEEYQAENDEDIQREPDNEPVIIVLSARKEPNLREYAQRLKGFIETSLQGQGKIGRLEDIAYTLQTGRDPLSYRLAFIARNPEEIIEKLSLFLNSQEPSEKNGFYVGHKTAEKKPRTEVAEDNLETVRPELVMGEKMAELWASGREIDWECMYQNERRFKVPLPTYPFSKERYWVGEARSFESPTEAVAPPGSAQGPLPASQALPTPTRPHPFFIAPRREGNSSADPDGVTALVRKQEDEKPEQPESGTFLTELCQAPISERQGITEKYLQNVLAELLALSPPDLPELHQGFFDMGMESVLIEQFRVSLEERFRIDIADTAIFDYPNISELSEYIIQCIPFSELEKQYAASSSNGLKTVFIAEQEKQKGEREPIAIIGMGYRFPGGCHNPETFWKFLAEGGDGVIEVPRDRWHFEDFYDPDPSVAGKMYLKEAGFLQENVGDFDARFFGISPREAVEMDPQQRLLLEVSWEALERAGIPANQLKGTQTGVFIGIISSEYGLLPRENVDANPYRLTGFMSNIASGRISYLLGVHGPSISLDTACSSSLVAVHLACESLHRGESSLALAGGVNLLLMPHGFLSLCSLHALSSDGRCKTFDASGDGYGRGEGCGIVVLKRLSDALRDKDPILAVIKATAVNQDGPSSGLTVPNGKAQKALILKALEAANVSPADIGYVELHGTGTALGDPIEFQALTEIFGKDNKREQPLYIGSVKSNIGHLEAAAGIASLIKSVLCLQNKQIPPNLHLHTINPKIRLGKIPAIVPQQMVPWETHGTHRTLGISAFGFSGTNAHAIVSEWEGTPLASSSFERPWHILALSAKDEKALSQAVARYGEHLEQNNGEKLEDICFTANVGRVHFPHRIAFLAEDREQLKKSLAAMYLRGNKGESVIEGKGQDHTHPKLAFLISGKIRPELAQFLFETQPTFQQTIRTCDERLQQLAHLSLLEKSTAGVRIPDGNTAGLLDDVLAFALHLSLLKVWETWGIRPNAILGSHSGALVAACAAGVMDVETALGFLLEHCGMMGKAASQKVLKDPQIRLVSGRTGQLVEKQEALSHRYWEQVLSGGLNRKKGMESLYILGYTHFLQTGIIDDTEDQEDLLDNSHAQYFPSLTESDPWRTLTTTLAHLYCLGLDIDWSGFEQGYSRRKVLLPTYPFQRSYFWCETTVEHLVPQRKTEKGPEERPMSSPFDGRITSSPIKTKQIKYSLSLDVAPDVKDVSGLLHVGYYLEMLSRAVKKIYQTTAFCVQTIDFLTGVMLPESGTVMLSLTLDAKKSSELDFAFFSRLDDENWKKHTQGTILLENTDSILRIDADLKSEITSRCGDQYAGIEFYQHMQERGLLLGEGVQWIEQVWSREGEALARLRQPRSLKILQEYAMGVHPGVFEACAQLFHAALSRSTDTGTRYMVTRWEDFAFYNQPVDQAFWCHIVLQDGPHTGRQLKGSFRLFDDNGTMVAQISGGIMKGLNKERENALRNYLAQSEKAKERKNEAKILRELRGLHQDQWRDYLKNYLQQVFAPILGVEANELRVDDTLMSIGMDSIVGMEAKHRLEEELDISLPIELFIVGPSIAELTESIIPCLSIKPAQTECESRDVTLPEYKTDVHSWIVYRKSNPQARVKLFCFPYGSVRGALAYREWQAMLPNYVEVCPVQLPGKGNRVKERAFIDIGRATEVLKEVLAPELDRPYAFYGHSAGALLAYRLAYKLWSEMDNKPRHLFVGAYSSPTILPNPLLSLHREKLQERGYDKIPDPESLSSIMPEKREEILAALHTALSESQESQSLWDESQELRHFILPMGLAELQMVGSYSSVDEVLFNIPITAFHGKVDDKVKESEMRAWQELTTGTFKCHTLPGGHLFLHEDQDQKQLLELVSHDLEKYK